VIETVSTRRIRLLLHYDGREFSGWQLQTDRRTVQGEVERVLSRLFDGPARIVGSGRTDRGVHAVGQVAAVDAPARWDPIALQKAMNALLSKDVWVAEAREVHAGFHPRYGALSRAYVYRIGVEPLTRSPFLRPWCWPLARLLDVAAMEEAAAVLPGDHSFRAFAKAGQEERGDRCVVTRAEWREWPALGLEFHVAANRFLHHMVRYLVGTMVDVGLGVRPAADLRALLAGEPDVGTSPPAPPEGLFLSRVVYPDDEPEAPAVVPFFSGGGDPPPQHESRP
jgi:tRNA pseudouridine38-40 synthase